MCSDRRGYTEADFQSPRGGFNLFEIRPRRWVDHVRCASIRAMGGVQGGGAVSHGSGDDVFLYSALPLPPAEWDRWDSCRVKVSARKGHSKQPVYECYRRHRHPPPWASCRLPRLLQLPHWIHRACNPYARDCGKVRTPPAPLPHQAELGCIGFAEDDQPRFFISFNHFTVVIWHKIFICL